MTKSELWILSEWRVAQNRVRDFSEDLIAHRYKTPYAELDLLFVSEQSAGRVYRVVEVKTWKSDALWASHVLSQKQRARILRACQYLSERSQCPVLPVLAVFDPQSLWRCGPLSGSDLGGDGIRYFELEPSY